MREVALLLMSSPDAAVLRIRYETDGAVAATDLGEVLSALGKAFERYARAARMRGGTRLAVRRVEVGSLVADLVIVGVGAAVSVTQHPEVLYSFVGFLGDMLTIAQGLKPGKNKQADTRLIETLLKPVADGHAQQVNIFVVGDGSTVTVDREAIALVRAARDEARAGSAKHGKIVKAADAAEDDPPLALSVPRHLNLEGKHGTAIDVKGRWSVRLQGEGGVLNPLELAPGVSVRDEQSYSFDGVWEGRSYRIRSAQSLG